MDPLNPDDHSHQEPPEAPQLAGRSMLILGVIAVAVVAVLAYIVVEAVGSDDTLAVEDTVRGVLDASYEKDSLPTWCNGGCSATDDEWHSSGDAESVAADLSEALTNAGLTPIVEAGPDDAFIVKVTDGDGLDIGVTGVGWGSATADATGTAIWFTSVSLFDQPPVSVQAG